MLKKSHEWLDCVPVTTTFFVDKKHLVF